MVGKRKPQRRTRRTFGRIRTTSIGRHQAGYLGPDGIVHNAPETFANLTDAERWLALVEEDISSGNWQAPAKGEEGVPPLFGEYAERWMAARIDGSGTAKKLSQKTVGEYQRYLDRFLLPAFRNSRLDRIEAVNVGNWYESMDPEAPNMRAKVYALLHGMLQDSISKGYRKDNPCQLRNVAAPRKHRPRPLTIDELIELHNALPERYRIPILVAGFCALRFGELTALRRGNFQFLDDGAGLIVVRSGVSRVSGVGAVEGPPKTEAGVRMIDIPTFLIPMIKAHMRDHVGFGDDALFIPARQDPTRFLAPSSLYKVFYPAREAIGRPDLHVHDLRHTGALLATMTGAPLKDIMRRLGHSSQQAAMIYQHATMGGDAKIAAGIDAMFADRQAVDDLFRRVKL